MRGWTGGGGWKGRGRRVGIKEEGGISPPHSFLKAGAYGTDGQKLTAQLLFLLTDFSHWRFLSCLSFFSRMGEKASRQF